MRYLVVVLMLVCGVAWGCDYCLENPGEKEIMNLDKNGSGMYNYNDLIIVRRINAVDKKVKHLGDSIDKIYSMVCDLETKFMGNDLTGRVLNPGDIPETTRQRKIKERIIHEENKSMIGRKVNYDKII